MKRLARMTELGVLAITATLGKAVTDAPPAQSADEPVFPIPTEVLEIRVRSEDFSRFCDRLSLTQEQSRIATAIYQEYQSQLRALDTDFASAMVRHFDAEDIREAFQKLYNASPQERAAFAFAEWTFERMRGMRPAVLSAFDRFVVDMTGLLSEEQAAHAELAVLALRRDVFLNPLIEAGDPETTEDLYVHVDLEALIEEAIGEELGVVFDESEVADRRPHTETLQADIAQLRHEYRTALDQIMTMRAVPVLNWRMKMLIAMGKDDRQAIRSLHRKRQGYSQDIYTLNVRTATRLANLLRERGYGKDADRFLDRLDAAHFPDTWREDRIDRLYQWVTTRGTISDDQRLRFDAEFARFRAKRSELRQIAKNLTIEFTFTTESTGAFGEFMEHPSFDKLIENMGARETLVKDTLARLNEVLTETEGEASTTTPLTPDERPLTGDSR